MNSWRKIPYYYFLEALVVFFTFAVVLALEDLGLVVFFGVLAMVLAVFCEVGFTTEAVVLRDFWEDFFELFTLTVLDVDFANLEVFVAMRALAATGARTFRVLK